MWTSDELKENLQTYSQTQNSEGKNHRCQKRRKKEPSAEAGGIAGVPVFTEEPKFPPLTVHASNLVIG